MLLKHYPIWIETWSTSIYITSCGFLKIIHVLQILCCFINAYPHSVIAIILVGKWDWEHASRLQILGSRKTNWKGSLRERERERYTGSTIIIMFILQNKAKFVFCVTNTVIYGKWWLCRIHVYMHVLVNDLKPKQTKTKPSWQ